MTVKALYHDDFPSKDRQENFGDDMLVNVQWRNNLLFASPVCFRAPRSMAWSVFKAEMVDTWARIDPEYDPAAPTDWKLDGRPLTPADATSLTDTGVVHKSLITFRT